MAYQVQLCRPSVIGSQEKVDNGFVTSAFSTPRLSLTVLDFRLNRRFKHSRNFVNSMGSAHMAITGQ